MTRIALALLTLALAASAQSGKPAAEAPAPAVWAVLKDRCEVRGLKLELGDVADVGSTELSAARRAARISLGATPLPGRRLRLTRSSIAELLAAGRHRVTMRGASAVDVVSETVTLQPSEVATLARRRFVRKIGEKAAGTRIMPFRMPQALVSRAGRFRTSWRVSLPDDPPHAGRIPVDVAAVVDGVEGATSRVHLIVHSRGPVLVAARSVQSGQRIEAADLRLEERDSTSVGNRTLASLEKAVGRIASRRLGLGEVLARSDVKEPPVLFRGDEVMLIARSGALTVKTTGVALGSGAPGDRIKLRTGKRRRIVDAVVVDSKTARITINSAKGGKTR